MALTDTTRNVYGPKQFGDLTFLIVKLQKAGGVASLVAAESSPDVALVSQPGAGVYNFSAPKGQTYHYVGGGVDPAASAIAAGVGSYVFPRLLSPSAGTFTLVVGASDGVEVDFPDSGFLYATLMVGQN